MKRKHQSTEKEIEAWTNKYYFFSSFSLMKFFYCPLIIERTVTVDLFFLKLFLRSFFFIFFSQYSKPYYSPLRYNSLCITCSLRFYSVLIPIVKFKPKGKWRDFKHSQNFLVSVLNWAWFYICQLFLTRLLIQS